MGEAFWRDRSVFLTGHTGFKGGWLALWLRRLGARIHGYSLDPPTEPNLFSAARIRSVLASHTHADIRSIQELRSALRFSEPEVVFHLAAQPLVRASYTMPIETFACNVMGTANLLEAARDLDTLRAIVVITTDKVYENKQSSEPYREDAALGGHDPYSASKAAAEIVSSSYRASFYARDKSLARIATARAGNVIGGGDWAADRLVPDCFRAFAKKVPVELRYPQAIRPWQHVLEPLEGYLQLAQSLHKDDQKMDCAWNFGPDVNADATVGAVARQLAEYWGPGAEVRFSGSDSHPHEHGILKLDSSQARSRLGWHPRWSLQDALAQSVAWQRAWLVGADMQDFSMRQIEEYVSSRQ